MFSNKICKFGLIVSLLVGSLAYSHVQVEPQATHVCVESVDFTEQREHNFSLEKTKKEKYTHPNALQTWSMHTYQHLKDIWHRFCACFRVGNKTHVSDEIALSVLKKAPIIEEDDASDWKIGAVHNPDASTETNFVPHHEVMDCVDDRMAHDAPTVLEQQPVHQDTTLSNHEVERDDTESLSTIGEDFYPIDNLKKRFKRRLRMLEDEAPKEQQDEEKKIRYQLFLKNLHKMVEEGDKWRFRGQLKNFSKIDLQYTVYQDKNIAEHCFDQNQKDMLFDLFLPEASVLESSQKFTQNRFAYHEVSQSDQSQDGVISESESLEKELYLYDIDVNANFKDGQTFLTYIAKHMDITCEGYFKGYNSQLRQLVAKAYHQAQAENNQEELAMLEAHYREYLMS